MTDHYLDWTGETIYLAPKTGEHLVKPNKTNNAWDLREVRRYNISSNTVVPYVTRMQSSGGDQRQCVQPFEHSVMATLLAMWPISRLMSRTVSSQSLLQGFREFKY